MLCTLGLRRPRELHCQIQLAWPGLSLGATPGAFLVATAFSIGDRLCAKMAGAGVYSPRCCKEKMHLMLKGPGEGRCPGEGRFWDAPVGALQLPWSASYLLLPGLDSRYRDSRSFSCCRLPRSCRPAGRLTCHGATKFASTTQAELAPTPGIAELVPTPTPLRCFPSSPRLCGISRTHVHTSTQQNSRPH